jgi:hypothetical protein
MFCITLQKLNLKVNLYMKKQDKQILLRGGLNQLKYPDG